jgi:site-specific DNA-methyltransferase (adenine-specific)
MEEIPNESVHLAITSPPYWQLKDYGVKGQIGFDDSYEEYINNLNLVWNECYRVLHPGCRLCINIGDQFARAVYYSRYKVIPIRTEIIKFCETRGFDYMGAIIWQKMTTTNTTGGATIMGSFPYPRNGILKLDYEFILTFKKLGEPPKVNRENKELSKLTIEEWNEYFSGHWNFPGEKQDTHLAMFPEELPHRLIKMFSFVGDTVLDPFLGSGTTTLSAKNLKRNSIGYEINGNYLERIKEKLEIKQKSIFQNEEYIFINRSAYQKDFSKEIEGLPYIFKDPIKFDKKVDPRKLKFGSKVDENSENSDEQLIVKDILSPSMMVLNNGVKIRLLGVKSENRNTVNAVKFLKEKVNKNRVFLRFDNIKYDDNGNLLCYLYLKNKTFINGHLLRSGYVEFDESLNFSKKEQLRKYYLQNDGIKSER